MKDQLRGSVKINVSGRELYPFINALHARRICIFRQYVKGGTLSAEIYRRDLKAVRRLADEMALELTFFEFDTLSTEMIRRRRRIGLLIGTFLILGAFFYFSSVVVTIEVQGNETVSDSVILSALAEIGIEEGSRFGQIDYIRSENQLRLMVDKLAWVGMHRTGNRLVVEVTEITEKPEMLRERIPCNVVSAYDAEIVDVMVEDGQLMHMVGDYVLKGDLLISGITSDPLKHIVTHHAMGKITGIYEDTAEFSCDLRKERLVPTGRTDQRRRLKLLSLDIPLYFGENRYEHSSTEQYEKPFTFLGKALPISLRTTKYRELTLTDEPVGEDELRAGLYEKIYLYEKNFLSGCEILDRQITEKKSADVLTLAVEYRLKGDICAQKEILVK